MAFQLASMPKDGGKSKAAIEIIAAIASIRQKRKYLNIKKPTPCKELSDVINANFKTNFKVIINPLITSNANMSIPLITRNNPMWAEVYRIWFPDELERVMEKNLAKSSDGIVLGEVKADGTLGGAFSKLEGEINVSYDMIHLSRWQVTPEGATGIILHEIGHFINFLRALTWSCRSNYILAQLNASVMGNVPRDQKVKFMKQIVDKEGLKIDDDINQIARLDNDKTILTVFVGAMNRKMRSELGDDVYNARGFEALSDNFAAQHGCGLDLVLAMDSMPAMRLARKGSTEKFIVNAMLVAMAGVAALTNPLALGIGCLLTILVYEPTTTIYDSPRDRFRRIATTLISKLRENRSGDNSKLIKQIEEIEQVMENYGDGRGYIQSVYEYVTPSGRNNLTVRELNQTLEDISSNKLYLAAAKFNQLGNRG